MDKIAIGVKWRKRLIKLVIITVIFLIICFILGALPVFRDQNSGLENYAPADSTLSLSAHLFPSEDFPDRFEYVEGEYEYYYNGILLDGYAVSFSVIEYEPEQYKAAKQFCLQEFTDTDEHQYQIGDYYFIEHLCYTSENDAGKYVISCQYPKCFNMFAYHDSTHTLLFIGYYEPDLEPETQLALTDFGAFYDTHFAKYYELEK